MDGPAQAEEANSLFRHLLVLCGPSVDWMTPTHIQKGDLHSVCRFKCESSLETSSQTHPQNNIFPTIWASQSDA